MQIGIVRAINDHLSWSLTITNGPTSNSNVQVTFTLPPEISISNSTIFPVGSLVANVWTIGAMTAGQTVSANIILNFDGPVPGISEEFTVVATVTGTGDTNGANNIKTDTVLFEIASCDPLAGGTNCITGLKFDLSTCSTPCTQGATSEWFITPGSEVNINIISFDEATGKGYYELIDPSISGSFTWGLNCILGLDTITICSTYTMTLHPLIVDKEVFNHSANFIQGSTLTNEEVSILQSQPAYAGLTNEQIRAYCWETFYNADGDLAGGWAHDCTGEQDNRHMVFCSETQCSEALNECPSCPYTNMPIDVSNYIESIENYTAEKGDVITVYHPGAISIYEYNGVAWVRNSCGCITFLDNPYPIGVSITGTTTKTLTITLSDLTTLTASFTDIDTNTTYSLVPATVDGICYVRLMNTITNTIVSSVQIACPNEAGCCCDCSFNLLPTPDGAIAETNCNIIWTGGSANAIWEWRPISGDELDWEPIDGDGLFNQEYNNGAADSYIRVRYTIDGCEKFSNIVTPPTCGCHAEIAITDNDTDVIIYRENEGCGNVNWAASKWQIRTNRNTWVDVQTGDGQFNYTTWEASGPGIAILATLNAEVDTTIGFRLMYVEGYCTKYTNIAYVYLPIIP